MTEIELETREEPTETDQNLQNESITVNRHMSTIGVVQYKEKDEHAVVFQNLTYSITKFTKFSPFLRDAPCKKVEIIRDASGYIPVNCLCGIIGQSGAGKTTLLGLLAGIPKSGTKTGSVAVSSKKIAFVSQIPHISETEKVYEILRFSSSVTYNSLNPDGTTSNKSRFNVISDRISKVLSTLNLSGVRDRQIRYLSGGELKRVSIAMQLMTQPDILVLDEPTSGLDTPNALSIVQTLRRIVKTHNCTVIMSIHQPHKRICDCMEWILSLKDGLLLYMGSLPDAFKCRDIFLNEIVSKLTLTQPIDAQNAIANNKYLKGKDVVRIRTESNGEDHETKNDDTYTPVIDEYFDMVVIQNLNNIYNVNIIDDENRYHINNNLLRLLITDIISDGHNTGNAADYLLETEFLSTTPKLYEHWLKYRDNKYTSFDNKIIDSLADNLNLEKKICTFDINNIFGCDVGDYCQSFVQCKTYRHAFWAFIGLSMRTLRYYYRKWWIFVFNVIISVAAAFVLGSIYGKMSEKQDDIQNRFGAFGFICIFIGIQAIAASGTFHEIRDVFIDDRNGKLYGATPFLFARSIPDLCLLRIVPSVLFGYILFDMLGLQQQTFGDFMSVVIILSVVSSLCVFTISSLMPDAYIAGFVAIFLNMLFMLYGGVFIQDESKIPAWIQWPKELSFYNFAFEILMVNEFQGLSFRIDSATVSIGGTDISFDSEKTDVRISGEFFLGFFGMNIDDVGYDWMMLIVWCVTYFFVAWLALELLYRSKR